MNTNQIIQTICIYLIPVLFAITIHEAMHGFVAYKCGDKTAKMLGRLTLNPLKHIDLFGTIFLPILLYYFGNFIFGYAKPVPVIPRNLKNLRRDMGLIAAAGPLSNLAMAIIWAIIAKIIILVSKETSGALLGPLFEMGYAGVQVNIMLFIINLMPIPPLDGSKVLSSLLPRKLAYYYDKINDKLGLLGLVIIIILLNFTGFSRVISSVILSFVNLVLSLFGIHI